MVEDDERSTAQSTRMGRGRRWHNGLAIACQVNVCSVLFDKLQLVSQKPTSMKTTGVIAKIKSATSLKVEHRHANCVVCQRKSSEIVAIYAPRGDSLPLCAKHLEEVKQAIQDRLAELGKK